MDASAITLSVPPRTLEGVTFTDGTLEDLEAWLAALPAAPDEAARRLRNGLMELNRAEGYFTARFPELELLRPTVRRLCRRLVATPDLQRLAQALQTELATGYKVAIVETLEERVPLEAGSPADSPTGMAVASIHRAPRRVLRSAPARPASRHAGAARAVGGGEPALPVGRGHGRARGARA